MPLGCVMLDVKGSVLEVEDVERLRHPAVGGVILFSRNFTSKKQITALIDQIHAIRMPKLLVAVDQEGGRVQRFKEGFTELPAMAQFGKLLNKFSEKQSDAVVKIVRSTGQLMAEELIACGVDFSFAPVLDIGEHADTVIGNRALHKDPDQLIRLADAYIDGMHSAGMRATGKHFPGHGHVTQDSHETLPVDARPFEEIESCDLKVFKALSSKLGAVMTAHVSYPNVDADIPTYSRFWLKKVLRNQLAYDGLIVSDDLTMKGAGEDLSVGKRCNAALVAGCDLLLVCNQLDDIEEGLNIINDPSNEMSINRLNRMRADKNKPLMSPKLSSAIKSQIEVLV